MKKRIESVKRGGEWLGLEHSHATPKSEGIYHHIHTPHTHVNEYAERAKGSFPKGREDAYPSGMRYDKEKPGHWGTGKLRRGSKGVVIGRKRNPPRS
jgi:hypothetical protein